MINALIKLDRATQLLAEAKTLDEVKAIANIAEAARAYARAARLGLEAYNHAAEVKVRAERKAGEMLAKIPKATGGKPYQSTSNNLLPVEKTLKELGVSKIQSSRWQEMAEIPEEQFEKFIEDAIGQTPITTSGIVKETRLIQMKNEFEKQSKTIKSLPPDIKLLEGDFFEKVKEVEDKSIDLLITDPPYQVMNDYEWDRKNPDFNDRWLKAVKPKLRDEHIGFIFCDARKQYEFETICRKYFEIKNRLIWIRKNLALGRVIKDRFISSYEVIFYFGTADLNFPPNWGEERFDSFEYAVPQSNFKEGKFHPTQKPLELFKRLIKLGSKQGQLVADVFAGSGTAAIACRDLNRSCILIEKETEYINIIRGRLWKLSV